MAVATCFHGTPSVCEQGLGAKHVVRQELAGRGQRRAAPAALDQLRAELGLERRDMLGNRGLADEELLSRSGERASTGNCCECAEPSFQ